MCCRGMIPRAKAEPGQEKQGASGLLDPWQSHSAPEQPTGSTSCPREPQFGMAGGGTAGEAGGELAAAFPSPDPKGEHRTSGEGGTKIPPKGD